MEQFWSRRIRSDRTLSDSQRIELDVNFLFKPARTEVVEAIAEAVRTHRGRFFGLMALPLQDMEASLAEMERCASRLGMKGILLYSNIAGAFPNEQQFRPMFEHAQRLDLQVLLHLPTR